ncbi:MAG: hypothetical protein IJU23_08330 [Proteobacteria bacterium]|nr:hypothetical protein [Pseudomonadota bacterium]
MRNRFACFLAMLSVCVLVSACLEHIKFSGSSCSIEGYECSSQLAVKSQCECDDCYICIDGHWKLDVWGLACGAPNAMRCLNGYSMVCKEGIWKADGNACCTSGETRCDNGVSQVCKTGVWVKGGSACKACTSGEMRCDNGVSQVCKNGVWVNDGSACDECTSGETRCQNYVSEICYNGQWMKGGNACRCYTRDKKCDNGNLIVCNENQWERTDDTCICNDNETRCQHHASQICKDGQWVEGGYGCCDTEGQIIGSSDHPLTCINGAWSYACISGSMTRDDWCFCNCKDETWQCQCTACAPGMKRCSSNKCNDATYPGGCSDDLSRRYYCQNGQLVEKLCPEDTRCVIKGNNSAMCVCDESTYPSSCSDDLTRYNYCRDGKIVNAACPGGTQCSMLNNKPVCKTTTEECVPGGTEYCYKNCNSSKTEGYYYYKGEVHTIKCPNADCHISDNRVVCGEYGCQVDICEQPCKDCMAPNIPSSCEYGVSKGLCGTDGMAYICGEEGKYYKNTKCVGNCYECGDGYWVACGEDEATACAGHDRPASDCSSQTLITEGGNVGDCCDLARYAPSCETMLRCDRTGHVVAIECKDNTTCVVNTHGRKYNGYIYDHTKYPLGFYECI